MRIVRRDIKDVLEDLPEICCVKPSKDDEWVMVQRGVQGHYPMHRRIDPLQYNRDIELTAPQYEAMLAGSVFGFDVPGADPECWKRHFERMGRAQSSN